MPRGAVRAILAPILVMAGLGYAAALVTVSVTTRSRVIPAGQPYAFCGLYLDCHLSATVEGYRTEPGPGGRHRYVVRVRFGNDARRASLTVTNPRVILVDGLGARLHPRASVGDVRLASQTSMVTEFVFDSAGVLVDPRLLISEGSWVDRLTEKLLIGDPDSFLHQPVELRVGSSEL